MKATVKSLLCLVLCLGLFCIPACGPAQNPDDGGSGGEQGGENPPEPETTMISFLRDKTFSNGFRITNFDGKDPVYLGYLHWDGGHEATADWTLAQWDSGDAMTPDVVPEKDGSKYTLRSEKNSRIVTVDTATGAYYLEENASLIYDAPRKSGEAWPHLLIEQGIASDVTMDELDNLYMDIDFTMTKYEDHMGADADKGLHAAQWQWYMIVQNMNTSSPDYGDMFWFGMQFFDNRYSIPPTSLTVDGGKYDASGKAIYIVNNRKALNYRPVEVGEAVSVHYDVLPDIKDALTKVQAMTEIESMKNTKLSDLKITSMNIGFELPGTYDIAVAVEKMDILGVEK